MTITAVLFGLLAAIAYGVADFLAGMLSKRVGVFLALLLVQLVGGAALGPWLVREPRAWRLVLSHPLLWVLCLALGAVTVGAYFSFYGALVRGPVSLVTPIAASYGALTAVLSLLLFHDHVSWLGWIGCTLVFVSVVWLLLPRSWSRNDFQDGRGLVLAVLAMLGFALEILLFSRLALTLGAVVATFLLRLSCVLGCWVLLPVKQLHAGGDAPRAVGQRVLVIAVLLVVSLADTSALLFLGRGLLLTSTSVSVTLMSASPLVTALLGFVFLRERLSLQQWMAGGVLLLGICCLG